MYGFVVDSEGQPLAGVNVRLTTSLDTVMAITSKTGFYKFFQVKGSNIRLNYSSLGLQIVDRSYPQYNTTDRVVAETIILKPQTSVLKEIVIKNINLSHLKRILYSLIWQHSNLIDEHYWKML